MAQQEEKKYSMKELQDYWQLWVNHPSTLFRRKIMEIKSKVEGKEPQRVAGVGEIIFLEDFLQFIRHVENEKDRDAMLKDKFFPEKEAK